MANHTERFTGRVADYEKYRLRYPAEVVEILRARCGLTSNDLIADIGAGTGMLAEPFLAAGNRVIAIEPNAEMRAACSLLQQRFPALQVIDAAAESTPLADSSIDLVTVGRAFHWFDRARALAEFERILKPGAWVTLVSNRRDREATEQGREYESILLEHGTDYAAVRGGYRSFDDLKPYGNAETFVMKIPGEERRTLEEFLGQTQSLSITPLPGHAHYVAMQQALRAFFGKWSVDGVLALNTTCEIIGWRTPRS